MATAKIRKIEYHVPEVGLKMPPRRRRGRPRSEEPYRKITVCIYERQALWLDRVALEIREVTGAYVTRTDLIRALVDRTEADLNLKAKNFKKAARSFFPSLFKAGGGKGGA